MPGGDREEQTYQLSNWIEYYFALLCTRDERTKERHPFFFSLCVQISYLLPLQFFSFLSLSSSFSFNEAIVLKALTSSSEARRKRVHSETKPSQEPPPDPQPPSVFLSLPSTHFIYPAVLPTRKEHHQFKAIPSKSLIHRIPSPTGRTCLLSLN